jgi:DNA mismatch repair protein MutS
VLFLRKLVPGGANRSYGIEVARLAGLPQEVVARARDILQNLESGELDEAGRPRVVARRAARVSAGQLGLFGGEAPAPQAPASAAPAVPPAHLKVLEALRTTSLDTTSPLEALNLLARLQKDLK